MAALLQSPLHRTTEAAFWPHLCRSRVDPSELSFQNLGFNACEIGLIQDCLGKDTVLPMDLHDWYQNTILELFELFDMFVV